MTPNEAMKQAQETGQIAITKETANILQAVAAFHESAANLIDVINDNMPCEMSDRETCDNVMLEFYKLFNPVLDYVFRTVGEITLKRVLFFQVIDKFEGL